jgi:hypothetical protein
MSRKRGRDPDSDSDSGNSTNAISPQAAALEPPMFSTSPTTGSFMGAPNNQTKKPAEISPLSSADGLEGFLGNMKISNTPPVTSPQVTSHQVTSAPQRDRSNTMGGKSKKRKTKYGGKKTKRKWSKKYKKSINCKKPKGFSQKQYCKYGRKTNKRRTKKTRRR